MASRSAKASAARLDANTRIAVLHGPDPMLKRLALDELCTALEQQHGQILPVILDGKTASLANVLDELRTYTLLQSHNLVIVDDADQFVKTYRAQMERYAGQPADHATLVLRAPKWHKGSLDKLIARVGAMVKCDPVSSQKAQTWLIDRARNHHQRGLTAPAAAFLVQRLGPDLMKLDTELAKLALMGQADQPIDPALVEQATGRSSSEKAWVVQDAVMEAVASGFPGQAIEKVHELVDLGGQADVLVGFAVADLMRKLNVALLLKRQGLSQSQIARDPGLWGPNRRTFAAFVRRFDPASARRLFKRALGAEARARSGLGQPVRNLECFCAALADEAQ